MRHKLWAGAAATVAVAVLAGCGTSSTGGTGLRTGVTTPKGSLSWENQAKAADPTGLLANVPNSDIDQLASTACNELDAGVTPIQLLTELALSLAAHNATSEQEQAVGFLLGYGVAAECPSHLPELANLAQQFGGQST